MIAHGNLKFADTTMTKRNQTGIHMSVLWTAEYLLNRFMGSKSSPISRDQTDVNKKYKKKQCTDLPDLTIQHIYTAIMTI